MLKDGKVDAFPTDESVLRAIVQQDGKPDDYLFLPDFTKSRNVGFALKKDEPRFKDAHQQGAARRRGVRRSRQDFRQHGSARNRRNRCRASSRSSRTETTGTMHPAFVARSKAAQPIWFVTPANFRQSLRQARQARPRLRQGGGLRAAARPASRAAVEQRHRRRAVRHRGRERRQERLPARAAAGRVAGRHLSLRQRAARYAACGAGLRARHLSLHALPQGARTRRCGWCCPTASMAKSSSRIAEGVTLARDLINTPANDMGPADLEAAARRWPSSTARNSARSSATTCSSRTFR